MFAEVLCERLREIMTLSSGQLAALQSHYELLKKWNQTLNLTRIEDLTEAVERHYAESLFLAAHLPAHTLAIVDIGSGAGFPGFPVAVVRPDCSMTLIESHQRKAVFLKEASRAVPNIKVLAKRADEVEEKFDLAISRAVSYEDLVRPIKKLAQSAVLLTGVEAPPAKIKLHWHPPIALPWGNGRYLRMSEQP